MALLAANSVLQGLTGMIGNQLVFRKHGDKTVVSKKPYRCRRRTSELQQLYLNKFKEASKYARTLLRDPDKYEYYTKLAKKHKKRCAYNLIISDYMLFIHIEEKETPKRGDRKRVVLTVTKKNNCKVNDVNVQLLSPSGETVAIGQANRISSSDWVFKLAAPPEKGSSIIVTALDAFGMPTIKQLQL